MGSLSDSRGLQDSMNIPEPQKDATHEMTGLESQIEYPLVSAIIVNYNGKKFLGECIQSLIDQTYKNMEIIVVDNASVDDSIEYLNSNFKGITIIENSENLGFAGGVNTGIRRAVGSYILTLNNDATAECQCVERLLSVITADDTIGLCATKMLFPDKRINSAGICISRSGAAWDRGMFETDVGQYDNREEIFGPCAGAALYRMKMLDEIGLFDEDFFLYMEDVDLAFRGRLAGWKCMFVPEAVVSHYHGGTAGFNSDLTVYYGNRNVLWWPVKDYPSKILLTSLPWIIGRSIAVILYYTVKGQGKVILKSKMDGLAGIPKMFGKRKTIRQRVPTKNMMNFLNRWYQSK